MISKILKLSLGLLLAVLIAGGAAALYLFLAGGGASTVEESVRNWFPSEAPATQGGGDTEPETSPSTAPSGIASQLRPLSVKPVAGAGIFTRNGAAWVRLVERETGHVYETSLEAPEIVRVTNTTVPRAEEAIFSENGTRVALRYVNDSGALETFYAKIETSGTSTEGTLVGTFLPQEITAITALSGENFFYVLNQNGKARGFSVSGSGKPVEIWSASVSEWSALSAGTDAVVLLSKPALNVEGFAYLLNLKSKAVSRLTGNVPGLSISVSPDRKRFIFSKTVDGSAELFLQDVVSGEVSDLGLSTLPEKCVWGSGSKELYCAVPKARTSGLPDIWYQGRVALNDTLWHINVETQVARNLLDLEEVARAPFDIIHPAISADGSYLIFENKRDNRLWVYTPSAGN